MKTRARTIGIDRDYLRRCKSSTPEQRLKWLASAVDFARTPKKKIERKR